MNRKEGVTSGSGYEAWKKRCLGRQGKEETVREEAEGRVLENMQRMLIQDRFGNIEETRHKNVKPEHTKIGGENKKAEEAKMVRTVLLKTAAEANRKRVRREFNSSRKRERDQTNLKKKIEWAMKFHGEEYGRRRMTLKNAKDQKVDKVKEKR